MSYLIHCLVASSLDAEVDHGVGKLPPHVELKREIVEPLGVRLVVMLLGPDPPGDHVVLDGAAEGPGKVPRQSGYIIVCLLECDIVVTSGAG